MVRFMRDFKHKFFVVILSILTFGFLVGCGTNETPLPVIPSAEEQFPSLDDAEYVLYVSPLDESRGYDFNQPSDIFYGADNLIYVADTGNDRIVMMDIGGQIQGFSGYIPHPEAITQNDSLQLLIVNKTNVVYKIDLFAHNHQIDSAPVDTVFEQASEPNRQFTGISVHNRFEYYVTVLDVADSSSNFVEFSFIYDFNADNTLKGPLPLFVNGTGLFSAIVPTSIVSIRERWLDISATQEVSPAFMFTQTGRTSLLNNSFKVQTTTTQINEGDEVIVPNTAYINTDFYDPTLYVNPEDMALDRNGFIYVVDAGSPQSPPAFYRFSSTSGNMLQAFIGDGSNGDNITFNNPKGIAVLPATEDQVVYIADTGNDRIVIFSLSNEL